MNTKRISFAACILIAGMSGHSWAATIFSANVPMYSVKVTDIRIPVNYGYVTGMNDLGHVCYWSNTYISGKRGFVWNGEENLVLSDTSSRDAYPRDINNSGRVVGFLSNHLGQKAAIWDDGVRRDLGGLGGDSSWALAVNDNGLVAGCAETANRELHLFLWDGALHDQGLLPSRYDNILGINNHGRIVGRGGGIIEGWIWENGQYTSLKDLEGGRYSSPSDINDNGLVVGMSYIDQSQSVAASWRDAQISALPLPEGADYSTAHSVNNLDQIVGTYRISGSRAKGCLWNDDGYWALEDRIVSDVDWEIREGWYVNDAGQILILAWADGHGFQELMLTPIPEPSTLVLLCMGAVGLLAWGSRRKGIRMICLLAVCVGGFRLRGTAVAQSLPKHQLTDLGYLTSTRDDLNASDLIVGYGIQQVPGLIRPPRSIGGNNQ